MKPKKKTSVNNYKKPKQKISLVKPLLLFEKTITTTKEKTYNTIEQNVQNYDQRLSIKSARNCTPRWDCHMNMKEHSISPFSNDSRQKSPYKCNIKNKSSLGTFTPKQKTKAKSKTQFYPSKKKSESQKKEIKLKCKMTKQQSNQQAYEKIVMEQLNKKKITERSEESQISISKIQKNEKMQLNLSKIHDTEIIKNNILKRLKQKYFVFPKQAKVILEKLKIKYVQEYPGLEFEQLKINAAVGVIQKLWRQKRMKRIIGDYLSLRDSSHSSFLKEHHFAQAKLDVTMDTGELLKKHQYINYEKKDLLEQQQNSTEINTAQKKHFNLKDLELEDNQPTFNNQNKMIKFIQCYREVSMERSKTKKNKGRTNVFNLQESLSEKCLMQKYYSKVFKDSPTKKNNFQLFALKSSQKFLQRSKQIIREPSQVIELEQRFETQLNDSEEKEIFKQQKNIEKKDEKKKKLPSQMSKGELDNIAEEALMQIINDFSQEYIAFTSKSTLKKKKKARMPGVNNNQQSIRHYLEGLVEYMLKTSQGDVLHQLNNFQPHNVLKIHHDSYDDQEQEPQRNQPIMPYHVFYSYEPLYQQKNFLIEEKDKKYRNFLEGLMSLRNGLFANCLSELLEKLKLEKTIMPWDQRLEFNRFINKKPDSEYLRFFLKQSINTICSNSAIQLGEFHVKNEEQEQQKLLKSIRQEYESEAHEWKQNYQHLSLKLELTNEIEDILLEQLLVEIGISELL